MSRKDDAWSKFAKSGRVEHYNLYKSICRAEQSADSKVAEDWVEV